MTVSARPATAAAPHVAAVACALLAFAACGAEGIPAPYTPPPNGADVCPSTADIVQRTTTAMEHDAFAALREDVHRILIDAGGMRVVLQVLVTVVQETERSTLTALTDLVQPGAGLGALTPHIVDLLRYVQSGQRAPDPAADAGHLPLRSAHAALQRCALPSLVRGAHDLLTVEVVQTQSGPVLAAPGTGERTWLRAVLEELAGLLEDPGLAAALQNTLQTLVVDQNGNVVDPAAADDARIGRSGFVLLLHIAARDIAADGFAPDQVRSLIDTVVTDRVLEPATRVRVSALLELLFLVLDPVRPAGADLRAAIDCAERADAEGAFAGMLFDGLTTPALDLAGTLRTAMAVGPQGGASVARRAAVDLLAVLGGHPALANDAARVLAAFLDDATSPHLVETLLALQGTGVVRELVDVVPAVQRCADAREALAP